MSYQVLARKWRPRSFSEMVGQSHVLRALINALDNNRLHHAFLFTGTRGVGKTTISRIFAKSLNCESGISSTPCGVCSACREIDEGRFIDLIEVDAASRTKVEDTRELLENVQYTPTRGRYKVYLIDEVHMLSNHSFNALLKTLEEPPPHVKFLLATTDPQKLPITILSRCLQFNLRRLSLDMIRDHLAKVLTAENIPYEPAALPLIARAADGSMRDALSLLDQAISFGAGQVLEQEARGMLGTVERDYIFALLDALAAHDGTRLMEEVQRLADSAPDFQDVLSELLSILHRVALAQLVPATLAQQPELEPALTRYLQAFSPEDIQLYYQIGLLGRRDLPYAPDARAGFEMVLLRMLAFYPAEQATASAPTATPAPRLATQAGEIAAVAAPVANTATIAATLPAATPAPRDSNDWAGLLANLRLPPLVQQIAANCSLRQRQQNHFSLVLEPSFRSMLTKQREDQLAQAVSDYLGQPASVSIQVTETSQHNGTTPAQMQAEKGRQRLQEAEASIRDDDVVRALQDTFQAEIEPNSIQPID